MSENSNPIEIIISQFDYDSGLLCLDFTNTVDWRTSDHPEEELRSYADLVAWGLGAGLLAPEDTAHLLQQADAHPQEASRWHSLAIELREALYRIFVALSLREGLERVDQADLDILTHAWRQAAQSMTMSMSGEGLKWGWQFNRDDFGRMLWPVTRSAVDLLESEQRDRVGQCEDDRGCGFLFLDTSRNRSRRWCSMDSCGNRAKAHRHYARAKKI